MLRTMVTFRPAMRTTLRDLRTLVVMSALPLAAVGGLPASGQTASSNAPVSPTLRCEEFAPADEFVEVDGISTHFVARGDRGPVVVLVHGFGSNTYTWRQTLDALGDQFRLYAVDLKGFGLTERPRDDQYHAMAYAAHLLGFLDALRLERPVLVGNSMGGAVSLIVALQHPERVGGLVLVDAAMPDFQPPELDLTDADHDGKPIEAGHGGGFEGAPASPRPVGMRFRPSPMLLRATITRRTLERGLRASFHDPSLVTPEMVEAYFLPSTIDGAMEALSAMFDPPAEALAAAARLLPRLGGLRVPTLIVWGRHDRIIPVAFAEEFVRRIAGARRVILEESGHLPHEEQPDQFNALLAGFLEEIEPEPRSPCEHP